MNIFKRLGRAVNDWLGQLARENKKNFGGAKLDCCSLNRQNCQYGEKRTVYVRADKK